MEQLELNLDEPNDICANCDGYGWLWYCNDDTKYICDECDGRGYLKNEPYPKEQASAD